MLRRSLYGKEYMAGGTGRRKLSDDQVREIRASNLKTGELAEKYQVHEHTIRMIRKRRDRKYVE